MLTTRGWWFLISVLGLLTFAVLAGEMTLTLLGFTLLLWFAWEWLAFAIRARAEPHLSGEPQEPEGETREREHRLRVPSRRCSQR